MKKVIVLGVGRVGLTMVEDLHREPSLEVAAADRASEALEACPTGVHTVQADLRDPEELGRVVAGYDLVVGAVPGFMGYQTVQRVLEAGVPVVDISFFPEDPFALHSTAVDNGVPALVDCGVAPGCSNLLLGRWFEELETTTAFRCWVGGLPVVRTWPYEYRAVFSPVDVIEEYTRPARLKIGGKVVIRPALSEVELLELPGVGTVEAFNTDGLRTLLETVPVPEMWERTVRYPGHADRMRMLRETGFFATDPVRVDGTEIRPLDLTAQLLTDAWRLPEGEEDLTVMRVEIEGEQGGDLVLHRFDLLDRYDRATGTTSMARTTGFAGTSMARLVLSGRWTRAGVAPPELVGQDEACYQAVVGDLLARGIEFQHTVLEPTAAVSI